VANAVGPRSWRFQELGVLWPAPQAVQAGAGMAPRRRAGAGAGGRKAIRTDLSAGWQPPDGNRSQMDPRRQ